jgi:3-hydroxyisobutyrate dehydrogenase-like beta-hydroxyacid dehydrogenase
MDLATYGFVGLGQMGGPMAANLAAAGLDLVVFDAAGTAERAPVGARAADSAAAVAAAAEVVFLSLPDGPVVEAVAGEIAAAPDRAAKTVVDLSTIGIAAAERVAETLSASGMAYIDAPVSGGRSGAEKGTVTVMCAGPAVAIEPLRRALDAIAGNVFVVGDRPGQGQAMKLLNNFLSAVAMTATSEAVAFGLAQGLDFATMLDVVNVSTGQNTATRDKFPQRVLTGSYDSGFAMALMTKDVALYRDSVGDAGTPGTLAAQVAETWQSANAAHPGADFTRIYQHIAGDG